MAVTTDALMTTTLQIYARDTLADAIFNYNALLFLLGQKARRILGGGEVIRLPFMTATNSGGGSYQAYDVITTAAVQGFAAGELNWKQYAKPVTISGYDELRNQGQPAVIDLLRSKIRQSELSLRNDINTDLFSDGTNNSSKGIDGLEIAVDSAGTYAGISRTGNTWLQSTETAVSGALTIARIRTLTTAVSAGGRESPDLYMTDQTVYNAYEALLQPDQRFTSMQLGDAGFKALEFHGAPLSWDSACTAQVFYALNTSYLQFVTHRDRNFITRPFQTPYNQDARVSLILYAGNLLNENPRLCGKLTSVSS